MPTLMSACGVLCSACPACRAAERGAAHQARTATAWRRIYGLREAPESMRARTAATAAAWPTPAPPSSAMVDQAA